jgi:hypothetical protein
MKTPEHLSVKRHWVGLGLVAVAVATVGWVGAGNAIAGGRNPAISRLGHETADIYKRTAEEPRLAGLLWARPAAIDQNTLDSVSCPTVHFCAVTDDIGDVLWYSGGKWSKAARVTRDQVPLGSISCAGPGFCAASIGQSLFPATYDGGKWTVPTEPDPSGYVFNSVSCPTRTLCVAVDGVGNFSVYNGRRWSPIAVADPGGVLASVSCPTPTFCLTINLDDDEDNPYSASTRSYNTKSWSRSTPMPANFGDGQAVSCTSNRFCAAIDDSGDAAVFNGSAWGRTTAIDTAATPTLLGALIAATNAVSCASPSFCVVVDENGNVMGYNGHKWSAPAPIDKSSSLSAISCPSPTFCVAVDDKGRVLVGT